MILRYNYRKKLIKKDPRLPVDKDANHLPIPDWKKLNIPLLHVSDLLNLHNLFIYIVIFINKIRKNYYIKILKSKPIISRVWDYKMILPLKFKGIGTDLATFGFRELDHRYIIQNLLKPGSIVCDIGANIGYYILMYNALLKGNVKIYAIEPDPRNVEFLKKNIILNNMVNRVTVEPLAMSDFNGTVSFHLAEQTNLSALNKSKLKRKYENVIEVQVRDISEYLSSLPHKIDLLRMDIEGAEIQIFKSLAANAEKLNNINRLPKTIIFEGHAWEYDGLGENKIHSSIKNLFEIGYTAKYLCNAVECFSPIRARGYKPEVVIDFGTRYYGIYREVNNIDAIDLICHEAGITTICLGCT